MPFLPGAGEAQGDPDKGRAEDIAERIRQAVSSAVEIDNRYAGILRRLKAPDGLEVTDDMLMDEARDMGEVQKAAGKYLGDDHIPHDKSPAENGKWWDGLTQEQREEYQTLFPAEIGALDGIPSAVRDSANRTVLDEVHAQVRHDLYQLGPEPPKTIVTAAGVVRNPEWTAWDALGGSRPPPLPGSDTTLRRTSSPTPRGPAMPITRRPPSTPSWTDCRQPRVVRTQATPRSSAIATGRL
ncbi:hypothetical protein GCM10010521_04220 [Streptomyces rameus]|uniref:Uncharacterized protein n=1 Tax=Streptomyces rameus TaxID=68261 RepID=A0ABP6MNP6_9ACTN